MKYQMIAFAVEMLVLIAGVIFLKLFTKGIKSDSAAFSMMTEWAYRLVINARNVLQDSSGEIKKQVVTEELKSLADKKGVALDDIQISALIEEAYERMMNEKSCEVSGCQ